MPMIVPSPERTATVTLPDVAIRQLSPPNSRSYRSVPSPDVSPRYVDPPGEGRCQLRTPGKPCVLSSPVDEVATILSPVGRNRDNNVLPFFCPFQSVLTARQEKIVRYFLGLRPLYRMLKYIA